MGIVANVSIFGIQTPEKSLVYGPHAQPLVSWIRRNMSYAVRTSGDATALSSVLREVVWQVDDSVAIVRMQSMDSLIANDIAAPRSRAVLSSVLASLALVLEAVGVAGVMAFAVARRTGEIGLRMALGARQVDVLQLVLRQAGRVTLLGLVFGLLASFWVSRTLDSLVFEISVHDGMTFLLVPLVLGAVSLASSLIPARRASRVDPLIALRAE